MTLSRNMASSETHPFLIHIDTEHPEGISSLSPGCPAMGNKSVRKTQEFE